MTWWRVLAARCRALVRPQRVRDEIDEELAFHLDMRARRHMRDGMSYTEAQAAAARAFGSVASVKERSYDIRGGGTLEALGRDLAYATRSIVKQRALSAVVIGIVAIGVGANAAILGVADRVLWRELPVANARALERFVAVADWDGFSYPQYRTLRGASDAFGGVLARWRQASTFVAGGGTPERRVVEMVSGNYFGVLGVQPTAGRLLSDADDRTVMSHPVVVVSDRYWRMRLGASEKIIGQTIRLDDYPFTVVGVAPRGFFGVEVGVAPDAWVPLAMHPVLFAAHRSLVDDNWVWLDVLGRRAPGVSTERAQALATITLRRFAEAPERRNGLMPRGVTLQPANRGLSRLRGTIATSLTVLIGLVAFVLVVACANVATLVGVRAMVRSREIGVRMALGASRLRVIRQLVLENLLLALAGGFVGTLVAIGASRELVRLLPPSSVPYEVDVTPDTRLLVIALLLSTGTGLLFGVAPAVRAARLDIARIIREGGEPRRFGRWRFGVRRAVVAGQAAISLVLVIGAGLFAKSVERLAAAPSGFDAEHVLMATISPSRNRYTPSTARAFYHALQTRLSSAPGVRAVGTADGPLLSGENNYNITTLYVPSTQRKSDPFALLVRNVGGNFFGATGMSVVRGRALDDRDQGRGAVSLVLNETAARTYFGDRDPVGQSAVLIGQPAIVVGVTRDAKYRTMREAMPQTVYLTFDQDTTGAVTLGRTVYVRTTGDPAAFKPTLESAVHDLDRTLPVYDLRTLADQRRRSMVSERVVALLSGMAGALALVLAAVGLYGLVAFDTQQRTRELGVRISLGAGRSRIVALVLRGVLGLLVVGVVVGIVLSRALSTLIAAQLYGVNAGDVMVVIAACATLSVAAIVAAAVPAWRASRLNPVEALRCE